ncbi:MAG: DUF7450 family protein, partial [Actinomycetota bacterium]
TALPAALDTDGDGWIDTVESHLGSDPANPANTPESVAIPVSCFDGLDNDLDGFADEADPGCQPPDLFKGTFPAAGADRFESTINLDDYDLATGFGICPLDFQGSGPTVVQRGDPVDVGGGLREVAVEIVAMQLGGTGTLLPGSPCNPGPSPSSFPATIIEDPSQPSQGMISDTNPDGGKDFPADSFFDIVFLVDTPLGLLPGGPPGGPVGAPVQVTNVIKSIPPYHSPGNPALNPNCYTVAGLPHQHCPKPPLDHFKCYLGKFPSFKERNVTLEDQFERKRTRVVRPDQFCNPVSKNGLEIFDPGGHLKRYRIEDLKGQAPFAPVEVFASNQFGTQALTVLRRVGLFVPSKKDQFPQPAALDHFKCYTVQGPAINKKVRLVDQFDEEDGKVERATVVKPRTLCNPVAKTIAGVTTPIGDSAWHLVCYSITTRKFKPRDVVARNQFGKEVVTVTKPVNLCVPSMKLLELPPPPPPPIEVDQFPDSQLVVHIITPTGNEVVTVTGPTTVEVNLAALADPDGDGLEQVPTEIVEMQLTGTSTLLGPMTITLRDASEHPGQAPLGEIEETANNTPGVLDLPPFTAAGTAQSFFDLAFEVDVVIQDVPTKLHTCVPMRPTATITHKPPADGEAYTTEQIVQLCDEQNQPTNFQFGPIVFVPNPA